MGREVSKAQQRVQFSLLPIRVQTDNSETAWIAACRKRVTRMASASAGKICTHPILLCCELPLPVQSESPDSTLRILHPELDLSTVSEGHNEVGTAVAIEPPARVREGAHISSLEQYRALYAESIANPDKFWAAQAREQLSWFRPFSDSAV